MHPYIPVCVEATRCLLLHSNDVIFFREVPEAIAWLISGLGLLPGLVTRERGCVL